MAIDQLGTRAISLRLSGCPPAWLGLPGKRAASSMTRRCGAGSAGTLTDMLTARLVLSVIEGLRSRHAAREKDCRPASYEIMTTMAGGPDARRVLLL